MDPRSARRISVVEDASALPAAVAEANAQLQGHGEGSLHALPPLRPEGSSRRLLRVQQQVLYLTAIELSLDQLERELAPDRIDRHEVLGALQGLLDSGRVFEPAPGRYRRIE